MTGADITGSNPILVTGSHRSGTTWIGKMIAAAPTVGYIHEPFNTHHNAGRCNANFRYRYEYITNENRDLYYEPIRKTLDFEYDLVSGMKSSRSPKEAGLKIREWSQFLLNRVLGKRPLVKDPFAFFSSEWLAATFSMKPVVCIRHPAAFVSSLKRLGWSFDFSNFLGQPLLMETYLGPFETEVHDYAKHRRDVVDEGVLLWRIFHHVILGFQRKHADWCYVRHEDVSGDPLTHFQTIFRRLGLHFTSRVKSTIRTYSGNRNPTEAPPHANTMFIRLDSERAIYNWKTRLSDREINKIRGQVEDIASHFYSDEEW